MNDVSYRFFVALNRDMESGHLVLFIHMSLFHALSNLGDKIIKQKGYFLSNFEKK